MKIMNRGSLIVLAVCIAASVFGQQTLTLEEALKRVEQDHPLAKAATKEQQQWTYRKRGSVAIPKTSFMLTHGQYNSIVKTDNNFTVEQTLPFPTAWSAETKLNSARAEAARWHAAEVVNDLRREVRELYERYHYHKAYFATLRQRDSLYATLARATATSYRAGDIPLIEKTAVETQYAEIHNQMQQHGDVVDRVVVQLQRLLALDVPMVPAGNWEMLTAPELKPTLTDNPALRQTAQELNVAARFKKREIAQSLPDVTIGYFNQSLTGYQTVDGSEVYYGSGTRFQGFMIGLSIPLFPFQHIADIRTATVGIETAQYRHDANLLAYNSALEEAWQQLASARRTLDYYRQSALANAVLIEGQSAASYRAGEMDYSRFILNQQQALGINERYLDAMLQYNLSVIMLQYIKGE